MNIKTLLTIISYTLGLLTTLYYIFLFIIGVTAGSHFIILYILMFLSMPSLFKFFSKDKKYFKVIKRLLTIFIIYFSLSFTVMSLFFMQQSSKEVDDADVIIVLGPGLVNGDKVSLTLQGRLDKAFEVWQDLKRPIVVSGGQGSDETVSEAFAMKNYLVQKGVPEELIYLEDKSTSTLENFDYSQKIIDKNNLGTNIVFVTNDFHVLRSSIYMKMANLEGTGVGSKSLFYLLPRFYSREYISLHLLILDIL